MRLGGPIFKTEYNDPQSWVAAVKNAGYRAAYCPVDVTADDLEIAAYGNVAKSADIVIAEVGAWSNPISPDETIRAEALKKCKDSLALADKIGARCCVNIAGSRGEKWDGPSPEDFKAETFDLIVETEREIIDAVVPTRTFYTLEAMPWMYPDSPDNYLRLIHAIDRKAFAVHLDPVNMIYSPHLYFANSAFIRECFTKLGAYIKSCHIKDIVLATHLTVQLDEVRPGRGTLDYATFLHEAQRLDADLPIMLEHLPTPEEYRLGADYIRSVAAREHLPL
ncbi:MAG: sugar phosphate isomerase/epimerase [Chloroflexota bacterium]